MRMRHCYMLPMNNCGMSNTVYDSKPDDKRAPGWRSRKIIMEAYRLMAKVASRHFSHFPATLLH